VESRTLEGKTIADLARPRLGMRVWKSGRTSGYTEGFIDGIRMKVSIYYPGTGHVRLEQVFRIVPLPGVGDIEISLAGDSGAVWVERSSGKAVGLHFAGEVDGPEHALAHDLSPVMQRLRVRLPGQPVALDPPAGRPVVRPIPPGQERPSRNGHGPSFWTGLMSLLRDLFGA
jgi:hypothetical protein